MAAVSGDRGWEPCEVWWKVCTARLWNRLVNMNDDRLMKKVFNWDKQQNGPWIEDMRDMFCEYGVEDVFLRSEKVNIVALKEMLFDKIKHTWAEEIWNKSKLRTYRDIKYDYYTENYVSYNLPKKRSD